MKRINIQTLFLTNLSCDVVLGFYQALSQNFIDLPLMAKQSWTLSNNLLKWDTFHYTKTCKHSIHMLPLHAHVCVSFEQGLTLRGYTGPMPVPPAHFFSGCAVSKPQHQYTKQTKNLKNSHEMCAGLQRASCFSSNNPLHPIAICHILTKTKTITTQWGMAGLNQHLFHTMVCNLLEHNNVVVKANFHIRLQGHSEFVKTTPKVTTNPKLRRRQLLHWSLLLIPVPRKKR